MIQGNVLVIEHVNCEKKQGIITQKINNFSFFLFLGNKKRATSILAMLNRLCKA